MNRHKIWPDCENGQVKGAALAGLDIRNVNNNKQWGAAPLPSPVLGAAARTYEPRTRAASAPGRQPPVRRRGRGVSPGAGRRSGPPATEHRTQRRPEMSSAIYQLPAFYQPSRFLPLPVTSTITSPLPLPAPGFVFLPQPPGFASRFTMARPVYQVPGV
jgi:hypothetical protein